MTVTYNLILILAESDSLETYRKYLTARFLGDKSLTPTVF